MVNTHRIYEQTIQLTDSTINETTYLYSIRSSKKINNSYNICIFERKEGEIISEFNKKIKCDSETANYMLQLLYENCVAPVHLFDVLDDFGF